MAEIQVVVMDGSGKKYNEYILPNITRAIIKALHFKIGYHFEKCTLPITINILGEYNG